MEWFYLLWMGAAIYLLAGLIIPSFFEKDSRTLLKFYKLYSLFGSIYVCSSCFISVFSNFASFVYSCISPDNSIAEPSGQELPFLLAMTHTQTFPLIFCFMDYWADIGLFLRGVKADLLDEDTIRFHHSLAILGIAFELYYWIGGGMMMCLLLDTVEVVFSMIEEVVSEFFPGTFDRQLRRWWAKLCWVFWLLFRLSWYFIVSIWSLATMIAYLFSAKGGIAGGTIEGKVAIFGLMTLFWVLYANYDHITQFLYHYKHNTNNLHEVLQMMWIPLPASARAGYVAKRDTKFAATPTTTTSTPTAIPTESRKDL